MDNRQERLESAKLALDDLHYNFQSLPEEQAGLHDICAEALEIAYGLMNDVQISEKIFFQSFLYMFFLLNQKNRLLILTFFQVMLV